MQTLLSTGILFFSLTAHGAGPQEFQGVQRLEMRVSSGDIKVTGVSGDTASVEIVKKRYDERCNLVVEKRGDLLFVELASKNLFSARCEADFRVKIPKAVALKFKEGSGDINVRGTSGPVAVEIGSGRVNVKAQLSALDIKSGSGDVRVQGLEAPATLRLGSGSARLVYEKVPAAGELSIRSNSGDAEVLFPKHAKIKTNFSAGSGSLKNRLGENPEARFTVSMKSGSGDLLVGQF
jgi:DUF4097 and DUF4098 domain-containing protein YvlB